jgi:hypothetical protein
MTGSPGSQFAIADAMLGPVLVVQAALTIEADQSFAVAGMKVGLELKRMIDFEPQTR